MADPDHCSIWDFQNVARSSLFSFHDFDIFSPPLVEGIIFHGCKILKMGFNLRLHYIKHLNKGLMKISPDSNAEIVIDMNLVADAVSE